MRSEYTAVIKHEGDWWLGWIEEVPGVNCQERTREELIETLEVTLREAGEIQPAAGWSTALPGPSAAATGSTSTR